MTTLGKLLLGTLLAWSASGVGIDAVAQTSLPYKTLIIRGATSVTTRENSKVGSKAFEPGKEGPGYKFLEGGRIIYRDVYLMFITQCVSEKVVTELGLLYELSGAKSGKINCDTAGRMGGRFLISGTWQTNVTVQGNVYDLSGSISVEQKAFLPTGGVDTASSSVTEQMKLRISGGKCQVLNYQSSKQSQEQSISSGRSIYSTTIASDAGTTCELQK